MTKQITKRYMWRMHSPPPDPIPPYEPEQFHTKYVEFARINDVDFNLKELSLPADKTWEDVHIEAVLDYQYEGSVELVFSVIAPKPNDHYEIELARYKKALTEYEVAKQEHEQEVKEWALWVEQEKKKELAIQLKQAENLLKQHGKL